MNRFPKFQALILVSLLVLPFYFTFTQATQPNILGGLTRVSISNTGEQGDGNMFTPGMLSGSGRLIAFEGIAGNLVPDDYNNAADIFVYDFASQTIEISSVNSDGIVGNDFSTYPDITYDGRYVTFRSNATNLVADDTNGVADIFVHDRLTNTTSRISLGLNGAESNGGSFFPRFSPNGRYIVFYSSASNLVPNDTNGYDDVFLYDINTGVTERISLSSTGEQADNHNRGRATLSFDGRYVAFQSSATNLVPNDTNNRDDIFLRDRVEGTTQRVSISSTGEQGNGHSQSTTISLDGRLVGFHSTASNFVTPDLYSNDDIFVHDLNTGITEQISRGMSGQDSDGNSEYATLSGDGQWVSFHSVSDNLVPNDTNGLNDVFVYNRQTGEMRRVSVSAVGEEGNGTSEYAAVSLNGQIVTFYSRADNLIEGDTNGFADVFVFTPLFQRTFFPIVGYR